VYVSISSFLVGLFLAGATASAAPINAKLAIPVGGISQWITLKGSDDRAPVLLFLHGGPGNSVMSYADRFTTGLQERFVVVQWDQRESGKTAKLNHSDKLLTVSLMTSDAVAVVRYLCGRFKQEKIYVAGHSWGGFLALQVADQVPQLLHACIASAPMINQVESEVRTLEWLLRNAREKKNTEAIVELEKVKIPFETGDQLYFHRRWLQLAEGKNSISRGFVNRWAKTWLPMFNEASRMNLFGLVPQIRCPVYFLVGSNDRQADSRITEDYFRAVQAEKKDLIWFTKSGHNLNLTESEKFQATIIALLPPKN
jgi:pimeloyl-ACP methyl ester carboxylesterase